jgi:hypothetical protein
LLVPKHILYSWILSECWCCLLLWLAYHRTLQEHLNHSYTTHHRNQNLSLWPSFEFFCLQDQWGGYRLLWQRHLLPFDKTNNLHHLSYLNALTVQKYSQTLYTAYYFCRNWSKVLYHFSIWNIQK